MKDEDDERPTKRLEESCSTQLKDINPVTADYDLERSKANQSHELVKVDYVQMEMPENEEEMKKAAPSMHLLKANSGSDTFYKTFGNKQILSQSKFLSQQMGAGFTANSSMSEIKGKPQAPPVTIKPKTKKSMGITYNPISASKKLKVATE